MKRAIAVLLFLCCITISVAQIVAVKKDSNGKYGFVDSSDNWIVQPQYDFAYWNEKSEFGEIKMYDDKKCGAVDKNGKIIVNRIYNKIDIYHKEGIIVTLQTPDYKSFDGVIRSDGKTILPCDYFRLKFTYSDPVLIEATNKEGKCGIYSLEGKEIVPCEYEYISIKRHGIEVENSEGYRGVYGKDGKLLLNVEYAEFPISPVGRYNLLNKGGNMKDNGYGNFTYSNGGKWGTCDSLYQITIPCEYDGISDYAWEDLIAVNKGGITNTKGTVGGKWGFWGDGREIIPCQYDEVSNFQNGVATVKLNGTVQLIKNPLKDGSQIQIAESSSPLNKKERGPVVSRYPAPDSDVDKDIPTAMKQAENSFAFIICNENYPDAPVPYSLNDGRMFKEYCQKALGLPEKNINFYEDATFGNIITAVEKMKQVADAYDGDASIIFYYAGHGFPDDKQQSAYLLPIDGNASDITTTGYSLAKFYKELAAMKLKSAVVFLDACFSGAKREDQMLAQSRGVAIKVKSDVPEGKMVVFSAAQGDETAHQMEEKHHGLFTYFLLKELQATGGDVDMGTLTEYVTKQVKRQSVVINNKKQTPTVIPSQALTNTWQTLKLR